MRIRNINLNLPEQRVIAKYNIELWLIENEQFSLVQNNQLVLYLDKDNFSFSVEFNKLIFSYWTEKKAESWQVVSYKVTQDRLYFDLFIPFKNQVVSYFLEVKNLDKELDFVESISKNYLAQLCDVIERHFVNYSIKKASISYKPNLGYCTATARLVIRSNTILIAAIGMNRFESLDRLKGLLGQALKWLSFLQNSFAPIKIEKLMIFAPNKVIEILAERLSLISLSEHKIELFEFDEISNTITFVNPFDQGDLGLSLAKHKKLLKVKMSSEIVKKIEWLKLLAPSLIETKENFDRSKIGFEINGLEFAAIYLKTGVIEFGCREKKLLLAENKEEIITLVKYISYYRHYDSPDKQHYYYKAKTENWLEQIISKNISALDPNIINHYFYRQVPIIKQNHKFIDLLAIRRDGQLVIIELKTVEDLDVAFQALDYWLRVEWYRLRGDFQKFYFPEIKIKNTSPLLYLVMPRLRCHRDLLTVASFIDPKVPLYRIAINDNWRQELKIESRERINKFGCV